MFWVKGILSPATLRTRTRLSAFDPYLFLRQSRFSSLEHMHSKALWCRYVGLAFILFDLAVVVSTFCLSLQCTSQRSICPRWMVLGGTACVHTAGTEGMHLGGSICLVCFSATAFLFPARSGPIFPTFRRISLSRFASQIHG